MKSEQDLGEELELYFVENDPLRTHVKFERELQNCLAP